MKIIDEREMQKKQQQQVEACCGGVQMLKNMRLVILSDMLVNPSFKMTTSFAKIARTTARIFLNLPNLPDKISVHASY